MKEFFPISSQKQLFQFMNLFFILLPGNLNKGSGSVFSINSPLSLTPRKRTLMFSSCRSRAAAPMPILLTFPGFRVFQAFLVLGDPEVQDCGCGLSEEEELLPLVGCCHWFTVGTARGCQGAVLEPGSPAGLQALQASIPPHGTAVSPAQALGFALVLQELHEVPLISHTSSFPSALLRVVPAADFVSHPSGLWDTH